MNSAALQIILVVNTFLAGIIVTLAVRYGLAHFRPHTHDAEHKPAQPDVKLPKAMREKLLADAAKQYEKILENSAGQFQLDLSKTTETLNKDLAVLGNQIISDEMKRYRASLDELEKHAETALNTTRQELAKHHEDLQATMLDKQKEALDKMNEEIEAEKAKLLEAIDTRMADAVASFLIDTMGHDVDLGAQVSYLTKMIEQHKDEFKKEVGTSETPAA